MVDVAQLVRASVCGTEGRGFESRLPPKNNSFSIREAFFVELTPLKNQKLNKLSMIFLIFLWIYLYAFFLICNFPGG